MPPSLAAIAQSLQYPDVTPGRTGETKTNAAFVGHRESLLWEPFMSVLEVSGSGLSNTKFVISADGRAIGEVDSSVMREQATISFADQVYKASREGAVSGAFFLEVDGRRVAVADKPSALRTSFNVQVDDRAYVFDQPGILFARKFVLTEKGRQVGSVVPQGLLVGRRAIATFPDELPPHGQAFLIWLVTVTWKRRSSGG